MILRSKLGLKFFCWLSICFLSLQKDEKGQCGGILNETSGSIRSVDRDGDGLYDNNLECVWVIVAPEATVIELKILYMDIEWHKTCDSDYVRIFDGYDSYPFDGLIEWLCGDIISPKIIQSYSNILFVEFVSDRDITYTGFQAAYRHISTTNSSGDTEDVENVSTTTIASISSLISENKADTFRNTSDSFISAINMSVIYLIYFIYQRCDIC